MTAAITAESPHELGRELGCKSAKIVQAFREGEPVDGFEIDVDDDGDEIAGWRAEPVDDDSLEASDIFGRLTKHREFGTDAVTFLESLEAGQRLEVRGTEVDLTELEDGTVEVFVASGHSKPVESADEAVEFIDEHTEPVDPDAHPLDDSPVHGRTTNALADVGFDTAEEVADALEEWDDVEAAASHLTTFDGVGSKGARQTVEYVQELTDWEASSEELIDIRCPHCGELFDRAPPGEYDESGGVECSTEGIDPDSADFEVGDCGETFWLEVTEEAYETYESKPDPEDPESGDEAGGYPPEVVWEVAREIADRITPDLIEVKPEGPPAQFRVEKGPSLTIDSIDDETVVPKVDGARTADDPLDPGEAADATVEAIDEKFGDFSVTGDPDGTESTADDKQGAPNTDIPKPDPDAAPLPKKQRPHPLLTDCREISDHDDHTIEWFEERRRGIGSSDVGAILGLSDHADPEEIWRTKVAPDEVTNKPWLDEYREFGTWFEEYILEYCEEEFPDTEIEQFGTLASAKWPLARANLDGFDVGSGKPVVEEIKTTEDDWDRVPPAYKAQVQHQMYVTGADESRVRQFISPIKRDRIPSLLEAFRELAFVDSEADRALADWLLDHGEVVTWVVEADEGFQERMIQREREFWAYVEAEQEPPPADPIGHIDLSDHPEVVSAMEKVAKARAEKDADEIQNVLEEAEEAKDACREAIEQAVASLPEDVRRQTPDFDAEDTTRVFVGPHKATLCETHGTEYWRLYEDQDAVQAWPDEGGQ